MTAGIDARDLYLDLMKRVLTRAAFPERYQDLEPWTPWKRHVVQLAHRALAPTRLAIVQRIDVDDSLRERGGDWPAAAETMVGLLRLGNLQECIENVLAGDVPGDLIETGVWRGGAAIFMRAVLAAYGVRDRIVWAADSFAGLPSPDPRYPVDVGDQHHTKPQLAVSLDEVKGNFARYRLLDEQVRFLVGWFEDTLPTAPIEKLAILRLDGDMYGSTMVALESLEPKVSPGGFVIIDDYVLQGAREAVHDYRSHKGITAPIQDIDKTGAYWRKT